MQAKINVLLVVVISTLGVWGCSQSGNDARATAAKVRQLEYRNSKLEEDYRASVAEVQVLRKKLATTQKQAEEIARQNQELQEVGKQREELQQKLSLSVDERDALRVQMTSFSKELQSLAAKAQQVVGGSKAANLMTTVSQQK
jgi:predicted RNase H-like nuclease (RuvC/YqgF family)